MFLVLLVSSSMLPLLHAFWGLGGDVSLEPVFGFLVVTTLPFYLLPVFCHGRRVATSGKPISTIAARTVL